MLGILFTSCSNSKETVEKTPEKKEQAPKTPKASEELEEM